MAINRDFIGRVYPESEPYEVSRVKIAEFADAIGDPNPLYRDPAAAQAAGHPDVIAPPTLAIVISQASTGKAIMDPELGVNYAMIVHGEQRFEYTRPIRAGDRLTSQATIANIRAAGRNALITTRTEIRTVDGEHVCTAQGSLVERGAEVTGTEAAGPAS